MKKNQISDILFMLPSCLAFVMIVIIPFFFGIYYSMTDWNGVSMSIKFVGLKNFIQAFSSIDFLFSFLITVAFTLINVTLVNLVGFSLALLVTSNVKFRTFYRAGFFVPYLIGGIVLGYIWQFIFNNAIPSLGQIFSISWLETSALSQAGLVIVVMSIVNTWQYAGYIMMIYVAAIQGIPQSLLEAARVDGAGYRTCVFKIIIPMVANAFTIALFLTLTASFKQFDTNLTLTAGGPATRFLGVPVKASQLLAMDIFNTASANKLAQAQAKAVILFIALAIISLIQVTINKRKEQEL